MGLTDVPRVVKFDSSGGGNDVHVVLETADEEFDIVKLHVVFALSCGVNCIIHVLFVMPCCRDGAEHDVPMQHEIRFPRLLILLKSSFG